MLLDLYHDTSVAVARDTEISAFCSMSKSRCNKNAQHHLMNESVRPQVLSPDCYLINCRVTDNVWESLLSSPQNLKWEDSKCPLTTVPPCAVSNLTCTGRLMHWFSSVGSWDRHTLHPAPTSPRARAEPSMWSANVCLVLLALGSVTCECLEGKEHIFSFWSPGMWHRPWHESTLLAKTVDAQTVAINSP